MVNVKISLSNVNFERTREGINNWKVPTDVKKDMFKFVDDYKLGKVNKGMSVKDNTIIKNIRVLKIPLEFINKSFTKLNTLDVEKWNKAIMNNELQSWKKMPYSHEMIRAMRIAFKTLVKWRLGETKSVEICGWLDTREKVRTPDYLKESEITKLYKACKTNYERYLVAVLFDTGARAEEFHNIRYEDIELPEGNNNFVKITLKDEYSKTSGRVVSLYWNNSLEAVKDYLDERKKEGITSNDAMFTRRYDNTRQFLNKLGLKVLGKRIHYHLFRHSSATHYASQLNRQQLCYKFGWKFSSNMPDVYISRAGMNNKELDDKFTNTELSEVKSNLVKETFERKKLQENLVSMQEQLDMFMKSNQFVNEQWEREKQDRQHEKDFLNEELKETKHYPALFGELPKKSK